MLEAHRSDRVLERYAEKAIFAREIALLLRTDPDVAFVGAPLQDFLCPSSRMP